MAEIICPMCGKPNPDDLDICQFCDAPLKPVTDALSRSQPPIHPGEEPTPKVTSELEPVLPKWLREVRQQARDSTEEDNEQASAEEEPKSTEEHGDLLAGLQAQADDDEEVPDWLAALRAKDAKPPAEDSESSEPEGVSGEESSLDEGEAADELPGWISNMENRAESPDDINGDRFADRDENTGIEADSQDALTAERSDFDLEAALRSAIETGALSSAESLNDAAPIESELPAWLSDSKDMQASAEGSNDTTGLTQENESGETAPLFDRQNPVSEDAIPEWLTPDRESGDQPSTQSEASTSEPDDVNGLPDWLSSSDVAGEDKRESGAGQRLDAEQAPLTSTGSDIPDWLKAMSEEDDGLTDAESTPPSQGDESMPPRSDIADTESLRSVDIKMGGDAAEPDETEITQESRTPGWLSSIGGEADKTPLQREDTGVSAFSQEDLRSAVQDNTAPAFVDKEGAPLSGEDVDAIFSMEMPDWLSNSDVTDDSKEAPSNVPEADLRPGELPDWVKAMRPVEAVISDMTSQESGSQLVEDKGPLAGLQGVLPQVAGVGPSSKPKPHAFKLQASDDQQASAALLDQLMAEEEQLKLVDSSPKYLSQRILRVAIFVLLFLVVGGTLFFKTRIAPIHLSVPAETSEALRIIEDDLLPDAPVLIVFDYQAALAGELEAASASLVDHMMLLKHPRLSLLASTPAGMGLAERFMANSQPGQPFVNLGYLPGGAASVLAFSQNPAAVKPVSVDGQSFLDTPFLQGISRLSDFSVVILLTDNPESARMWIEQTETDRGESRLLIVSSAQAGPMLQPYVESRQVDGMVTGIDGGGPIEQINSGRPGFIRNYWDAYGFGLLVAVLMISVGSLWSLFVSWQMHRTQQGQG